ncbi:type II secretion system protein [Endothiovibrio diazotrophicus]
MKSMRNIARGQQGFTLIELVMVIVILGILAAVAVPKFSNLSGQASTSVCQSIVGAIQSSAAISLATAQANNTTMPTLANVIANTSIPTGWTATPDATTTGFIDVANGSGTTCRTADLGPNGLGMTSN